MFRSNSRLAGIIILSMTISLFFTMGCGSSAEKQKMTTLIQEFNQVVEAYAKAVQGSDEGKKSELNAKVKDLMAVWGTAKSDMMDAITPQDLDQLDNAYRKIAQKYKSLTQNS